MRKYQSHKIVEAGKITNFLFNGEEGCRIEVDDDEYVNVDEATYKRIIGNPEYRKGGYLVRYSDGYISWSPAQAFEEGYTLFDA